MKSPRGSGKYSPKALRAVRREQQVIELRRQGLTFAEIAVKVGYANGGGAKKAFDRGMERGRREPPELQRQLELYGLDQLLWSTNQCEPTATTYPQKLRIHKIKMDLLDLRMALTYYHRYQPLSVRTTEADLRCEQLLDGTATNIVDGDWTEALSLRESGSTFAEIADRLGLANGTTARRIIERDLTLYLAGTVDAYRAQILEAVQELFRDQWPTAISPNARPLDIERVLKTIRIRIDLLQLCPTLELVERPGRQEQKQLRRELQHIIDSEPYPGYPIFLGDGPGRLTPEFVESVRQDAQHTAPPEAA